MFGMWSVLFLLFDFISISKIVDVCGVLCHGSDYIGAKCFNSDLSPLHGTG